MRRRKGKETLAGLRRERDAARAEAQKERERFDQLAEEKAADERTANNRISGLQKQLSGAREAADLLKQCCVDLQRNLDEARGYIIRVRESERPVERRYGERRQEQFDGGTAMASDRDMTDFPHLFKRCAREKRWYEIHP